MANDTEALEHPAATTTLDRLRPAEAPTALAGSDQQRAIAEVQAAMLIARMNPRDPIRAIEFIKQDCTRESLAKQALYSYARGGSDVSGPSIRLAECIAQRWGNMQFGIRELEQRQGESVVQAYAWDVESNTRREMTFTVPHVRETRDKRTRQRVSVELTDSRDVYELTANMGARRLRACILGVIPGDVTEAAVEQVEETLRTKEKVTPERVAKMVEVFAGYGVTREQIEKRVQRRLDAITPALMVQLRKIANSLRDGMSGPADWFETPSTSVQAHRESAEAGSEEEPVRKETKPRERETKRSARETKPPAREEVAEDDEDPAPPRKGKDTARPDVRETPVF